VSGFQNYKTQVLTPVDSLKADVKYFEDWGITDALAEIQNNPDKALKLSPRWSIHEEDSNALYIRDNNAVNARYKIGAGRQVDI
jgi:hypothetical protein